MNRNLTQYALGNGKNFPGLDPLYFKRELISPPNAPYKDLEFTRPLSMTEVHETISFYLIRETNLDICDYMDLEKKLNKEIRDVYTAYIKNFYSTF
jgi:hypothetical protein